MSWDGLYINERHYPDFKPGDEVYPIKKYRSITKGKEYIVIECFNPYSSFENVRKIKIKTDKGYIAEFASYNFTKSKRQIREDKIKSIL
jgi:hypothetical protein